MAIFNKLKETSASEIRKLFDLAQGKEGVISLGIGEPDFETPEVVKEAAKKAIDEGYTHYSPNIGREDLRNEVLKKVRERNQIEADLENIMITVGANQAFLLSLSTFIEEGDEVLIPSPGFVSYAPSVKFAGGEPVEYPLKDENNFRPQIKDLKDLVTEDTEAIFLNSPSNPTGAVLRRKDIEKIADFIIEHDLKAITDEIYEDIIYEEDHESLASIDEIFDQVITINGFSKNFAMTGWRLGYVVAPKETIDLMVRFQMYNATCPPNFSQKAVADVMNTSEGRKAINHMVNSYEERRNLVIDRIEEMPNIELKKPEGAFYAFPNIEKTGMSSKEFSERLIEEEKVVIVPGSAFGEHGEGNVRLSYATDYDQIEKAMNRMENFINNID